jgi:hypothetical protein
MKWILVFSLSLCSLMGCAGHFEEVRLVGLKAPRAAATSADNNDDGRARCREIDEKRRQAYSAAIVIDTIAGTTILSSIALFAKDENTSGLITGIGSAVLSGAGVVTHYLATDLADEYIREGCAK